MEEQWKDIVGYEGLYQISGHGKVFSLTKNIIIKPFLNKGYFRIGLYHNTETKKFLIHRLVIEHFGEKKPCDTAQVNHKDLNKLNNHITNLEWCSPSENVQHCIKNTEGREEYLKTTMSEIGKKYGHIGINASKKPVAQIDLSTGEIIATFESAREASRQTGANYRNISQVCRGDKKTHMGYGWKFI